MRPFWALLRMSLTMTQSKFTADKRVQFCKMIAETGSISEACEAVGVSRSIFKRAKSQDEAFDTLYASAQADFADALEKEAYRRAVDGWEEEKMSASGKSYTVKRFDAGLLSMLLKAKKPEEFGDRVSVTGAIEHKHEHTAKVDLTALGAQQRAALRMLLAPGESGKAETERLISIDHDVVIDEHGPQPDALAPEE